LLAARASDPGPLEIALRHKARTGAPGAAIGRAVAAGKGWRVVDVVCTSGPEDCPFDERHAESSISLVLSGTFTYRGPRGATLLSPGALLLANAGDTFECSHHTGVGDRCLSFQFEPELFLRLAHDAGAIARFGIDRLPPLRALSRVTARAYAAVSQDDSFEEIALELAGAALAEVGRGQAATRAARDDAAVAATLRYLEAHPAGRHSVADLARAAGLSPFHFLRTFKRVTGTTPHQWLLRLRLRRAAERLVATRDPITQIALDVGFDDLSNFIRSFRAEFGLSPSRYRGRG
jgi:AraC-like DNA-binding protein